MAWPDFGRWVNVAAYRARQASVPLQSKRGCPFTCIYCTYGACEGTARAVLDPEEVVRQVRSLVERGQRDIEFVDAVFNAPYDHALAVCEALARARTGARLLTHNLNPRYVDDKLSTRWNGPASAASALPRKAARTRCSPRSARTIRRSNLAPQRTLSGAASCPASGCSCWAPARPRNHGGDVRFAHERIALKDVVFFGLGSGSTRARSSSR